MILIDQEIGILSQVNVQELGIYPTMDPKPHIQMFTLKYAIGG